MAYVCGFGPNKLLPLRRDECFGGPIKPSHAFRRVCPVLVPGVSGASLGKEDCERVRAVRRLERLGRKRGRADSFVIVEIYRSVKICGDFQGHSPENGMANEGEI